MFFRFGATNSRKKIGIITKIIKRGAKTSVDFTDLSNIFNRVATIAPDSALDFTNADDQRRMLDGYIVDDITELPETGASDDKEWGINLIG